MTGAYFKIKLSLSLHDDKTWIQFLIEMKILQAVHTLILEHSIWNPFQGITALNYRDHLVLEG